jgi:quercetin dioxygenase-like cupin family protein
VRVVYEDAGEPFVMGEGDLVLQPPEIRHRVLESSSGLEVVEITAPALHATFADHLLDLPNDVNSARVFEGQKFLHHLSSAVSWTEYGCGEAQETAVSEASGGVADVRTVRSGRTSILDFPPHEGELVFGFVLTGSAVLECSQGAKIDAGDAFVVPPGEAWRLGELSRDFRMLHITTASLD